MTRDHAATPPTQQSAMTTISMRWLKHEDGSYGVELLVSGLTSEAQAEAAMVHLQRTLCGQEISTN
jgi:hypothetical protein